MPSGVPDRDPIEVSNAVWGTRSRRDRGRGCAPGIRDPRGIELRMQLGHARPLPSGLRDGSTACARPRGWYMRCPRGLPALGRPTRRYLEGDLGLRSRAVADPVVACGRAVRWRRGSGGGMRADGQMASRILWWHAGGRSDGVADPVAACAAAVRCRCRLRDPGRGRGRMAWRLLQPRARSRLPGDMQARPAGQDRPRRHAAGPRPSPEPIGRASGHMALMYSVSYLSPLVQRWAIWATRRACRRAVSPRVIHDSDTVIDSLLASDSSPECIACARDGNASSSSGPCVRRGLGPHERQVSLASRYVSGSFYYGKSLSLTGSSPGPVM
jgi:hypothetical protein